MEITQIKALIIRDRSRNYLRTTTLDYLHNARDLLAGTYTEISLSDHTRLCPAKPEFLLEHTDYACSVIYFCQRCKRFMYEVD